MPVGEDYDDQRGAEYGSAMPIGEDGVADRQESQRQKFSQSKGANNLRPSQNVKIACEDHKDRKQGE